MIGEKAPDFTLCGYQNDDYVWQTLSKDYKNKRVVIVFYPHDFTFICPFEILAFSDSKKEFERLDTEIIFVSCDSKYVHKAWMEQEPEHGGVKGNVYPMLSDVNRKVTISYNMLDKTSNVSARGTIILDKDHEIRFQATYDESIRRSVDEIIRIVETIKCLEKTANLQCCPIIDKKNHESEK